MLKQFCKTHLTFVECEQLNSSKPELSYSDTLPSRGVLMVNKSRQSSVLRDVNSTTANTQGPAKQDNKPEMTNVQAGKCPLHECRIENMLKSDSF